MNQTAYASSRALGAFLLLGALLLPRGTPAQVMPKRAVGTEVSAPVPLSLTASDGAGLELVSLHANAVVEDPLAFTELRLVFRNPENRVREGRFRITLPSGATISRFAMRIGDRLQEGEVVEQQAARIAYEDFLHRRQDPALLETEAGNEFSARVFPIPANGQKELIVSYSQELTRTDDPYRLPLRGLPKLGSLTIRALVSKADAGAGKKPASSLGGARMQHEVVEVSKRDYTPDRDFEVAHSGHGGRLGLRHDNLVAARIVPIAESDRRDDVASLFVLLDTSASRALGLADQLSALEGLFGELARLNDPKLTVAVFDQTVSQVYAGRASALGRGLRDKVLSRRALGASDLDGALGAAAGMLKKEKHARMLVVSDGVATAGAVSADKLGPRVKALASLGVERLDVLAVGGIRDDALLGHLVTAGLSRDGVVLDAGLPASTVTSKLTRATRSGLKVEIDGAGWVWPSVLNGVQPGDQLVVYADLPAEQAFRVKVGGQPLALAGTLDQVERPLLERAWVKARIARLLAQRDAVAASDPDLAEALQKQVIDLSVRNRVLCPLTALLVLETEQDYARFNIERRALAQILTVGPAGVTLLDRSDVAPVIANVAAPERDDSVPALARPGRPGEPARGQAERKGGAAPKLDEGAPAMSMEAPREAAKRRAAPEAPASAPAPMARESEALGAAGGGAATRGGSSGGPPLPPAPRARRPAPLVAREEKRPERPALSGTLKEVVDMLKRGDKQPALQKALAWRDRDAADVLALVALGECWEALGDTAQAARAYGSIIDLFPGRADMRRFAGERLERVRDAAALALAIDTYEKSVAQRPDHPAGHRLLGFALHKQGKAKQAFEALAAGVAQRYPEGRFRGVDQILREDLGLLAAAWIRAEPARAADVRERLRRAGGRVEDAPSIRFVLNWETDANDVDFHIYDSKGGHAFYSAPHLPSGGDLYADVTTGYGPECFTIRGPKAKRSYPYKLQAHYYSRGPMGYGMGKLEVIDHDGQGRLHFEERPFVIMQDGAFVSLGNVQAGSALLVAR